MLIKRLKVKKGFKLIFFGLILLFISLILFKISDRNAIISMININKIITLYQENNKIVVDKGDSFVMGNFKTKLYNHEPKIKAGPKALTREIISEPKINVRPKALKMLESAIKPQINSGHLLSPKQQYRNIGNAYTDSVFRILIWGDACREMASNIHILGFAFGKPFRSKSLEILEWGKVEWERDGWVAMHNSYLDMIYRAGIIGIGVIIALLAILYAMIKKILSINSFSGILLFAVLINWLIASNFLEILELPYTAIVFWSLLGMLYAYLFKPIKSDALTEPSINNGHIG